MTERAKDLTKLFMHLLVSYALFAILFAIAFSQDGLRGFVMAAKFVVWIQIPGVLIVKYFFEDRFGDVESTMIGTGMGLAVIPFLVYAINIFELMHTGELCYLVSAGLTIVFFALFCLRRPEKTI